MIGIKYNSLADLNGQALACLLYTSRTTMAINRGKQDREVEQNPKNGPSSDCRLQPACMKLELLVIADQHAACLLYTSRRLHLRCLRLPKEYWPPRYVSISAIL